MLEDCPGEVAADIREYSGHGGLTREDRHYDDVGQHQPSELARIQRCRLAGGRGELPQPVQVADKEWMCDR